jgi:hypothetical protein
VTPLDGKQPHVAHELDEKRDAEEQQDCADFREHVAGGEETHDRGDDGVRRGRGRCRRHGRLRRRWRRFRRSGGGGRSAEGEVRRDLWHRARALDGRWGRRRGRSRGTATELENVQRLFERHVLALEGVEAVGDVATGPSLKLPSEKPTQRSEEHEAPEVAAEKSPTGRHDRQYPHHASCPR